MTYVICAFALVGSLLAYQRLVLANPLTVAERHWAAIATDDPEIPNQYSPNASLTWINGSSAQTYYGQDIERLWEQVSRQYQIQNYQVLRQERGDRSIKAEIKVATKPVRGNTEELSLVYQAKFDDQGRIIREVWQANPRLSV